MPRWTGPRGYAVEQVTVQRDGHTAVLLRVTQSSPIGPRFLGEVYRVEDLPALLPFPLDQLVEDD